MESWEVLWTYSDQKQFQTEARPAVEGCRRMSGEEFESQTSKVNRNGTGPRLTDARTAKKQYSIN